MIGRAGLILAMAIAILCGGCSMRGMVNKMVSDEDRALAMRVLGDIRSGQSAKLKPLLAPEIWAESENEIAQAPGQFPTAPGSTEFISYSTSSNYENGKTTQAKSFTLVTTDQQIWTTTKLEFRGSGGPLQLTAWQVNGAREKPADLKTLEAIDKVLPIIGIVVLLFVIGLIVLIVFLVRRSSRRDRERGILPPH